MSLLIRTMLEAERDSAMDLISHEAGLQAILREEGLRAAMQAADATAGSRKIMAQPAWRCQIGVRMRTRKRDLR